MSSFKQLTKDGVLKRADAYKVQFMDITVEPGFNTREEGERLEAHVQSIFQFIMDGGQVPALEVVPTSEGKVKVVDGHCRRRAYGMAIAAGAPIEWIEVRQFMGNDADRAARICTSNEGLQLTPLEVARVYKRLRGFGLGPEDIAAKVGKTRQHVDQMLILADAPQQVQQMVAAGDVSATEAIKVVRQSGDLATALLKDARAQAGKKVTAKALKPWTPPAKVVQPLVAAVSDFIGVFDIEARMLIEQEDANPDASVTIKASELRALFEQFGVLEQARDEAAAKAREQAAKASQMELGA